MDDIKEKTELRLVWWPSPQDYNEAVQTPEYSYEDDQLRRGQVELTALGLPRPLSGNFASVYKVDCVQSHFAVRCFLRNIPDHRHRYKHIAITLERTKMTAFVPFSYLERGIRINGQWFPVLKMEWAQGDSLVDCVNQNISNPTAIQNLAESFKQLTFELRQHGIAHGDLQHGNILVDNGALRLVDYDGMYVPAFAGLNSNELGHPNYQHPSRSAADFYAGLDNFSAWLIYLSLLIISRDTTLWYRLQGGDDCLILKKADLSKPLSSRSFYLLEKHDDAEIRRYSRLLRTLLQMRIADIPFLDEPVADPEFLPEVQAPPASSNDSSPMKETPLSKGEAEFQWDAPSGAGASFLARSMSSTGTSGASANAANGVIASALFIVAMLAGAGWYEAHRAPERPRDAGVVELSPTLVPENTQDPSGDGTAAMETLYARAKQESRTNSRYAVDLYTRAIDAAPVVTDRYNAWPLIKSLYGRADCYQRLGEPKLAIEDLKVAEDKLKTFYPEKAEELDYVRTEMAQSAVALGHFNEAVALYMKGIRGATNPARAESEADSVNYVLRTQFGKERVVPAESYRAFVALCVNLQLYRPAQDALQSLNDAAMYYLDSGRLDESKRVLDMALEIERTNPEHFRGKEMQSKAILERLENQR